MSSFCQVHENGRKHSGKSRTLMQSRGDKTVIHTGPLINSWQVVPEPKEGAGFRIAAGNQCPRPQWAQLCVRRWLTLESSFALVGGRYPQRNTVFQIAVGRSGGAPPLPGHAVGVIVSIPRGDLGAHHPGNRRGEGSMRKGGEARKILRLLNSGPLKVLVGSHRRDGEGRAIKA